MTARRLGRKSACRESLMSLLENRLLEVYPGGWRRARLSGVIRDPSRENEKPFRISPSRQEILRDFEKLIEEKKLFGAAHDPAIIDGGEFDPTVVKKKGKGTRFLVRKVPPGRSCSDAGRASSKTRFRRVTSSRRSPPGPTSSNTGTILLLFGMDRIIYDADIFHAEESVGELTLSFASVRDPALGLLAYFSGARLRVVRIEHIHLTEQRSGYASALFRRYERFFGDLGFDQFRLSASLSVGKYYWAKEGFDFADASEIGRRKEELRALVKERSVPVTEVEIERLNHAHDFVRFKRDVRIPVYRDAEGYYSFRRDDRFREEVFLPLGKAFLLCSAPWEGYKTIQTNAPAGRGTPLGSRASNVGSAGQRAMKEGRP